ncbi:MAG: hypothetical protein ACRECH_09675 [Nitrososphaerales archaeon]
MRRRVKALLALIAIGVLVAFFSVDLQVVNFPSSKVHITYFIVDTNYETGAFTGGCSPPAHQAIPDSYSINPGTTVEENMTLKGIITNVKCTLYSINVTTPGFQLVSLSPSPPYVLVNGTKIGLNILIRTPSRGFEGPVTIQINGNAQLLS